jgi:hypothetical protein
MPCPQIHLLACTLLALGPWGCVHTTEWVDDEPPRSYWPLDKTRRELGYGKFAAFDFGNHIVVYATGYECSTSWGHELVPERGPDGRGVLTLYRQAPFIAGAAITPFTVSAVVRPPVGPYVTHPSVDVRDAAGPRAIPVRPPPDAMTSTEWSRQTTATQPARTRQNSPSARHAGS